LFGRINVKAQIQTKLSNLPQLVLRNRKYEAAIQKNTNEQLASSIGREKIPEKDLMLTNQIQHSPDPIRDIFAASDFGAMHPKHLSVFPRQESTYRSSPLVANRVRNLRD
jgi:hypothetical protein